MITQNHSNPKQRFTRSIVRKYDQLGKWQVTILKELITVGTFVDTKSVMERFSKSVFVLGKNILIKMQKKNLFYNLWLRLVPYIKLKTVTGNHRASLSCIFRSLNRISQKSNSSDRYLWGFNVHTVAWVNWKGNPQAESRSGKYLSKSDIIIYKQVD